MPALNTYYDPNDPECRPIQEKTCPRCGETYGPDAFHKDKSRKDGLSNYCKACRAIISSDSQRKARYLKKDPEHRTLPPELKTCPRCGRVQPLRYFYKDSSRKDGHATYCKSCDNNLRSDRSRKKSSVIHGPNISRANTRTTYRKCSRCRKYKPRHHFGPTNNIKDGLRSWCKACEAYVAKEKRTTFDDDWYRRETKRHDEATRQAEYYQTRKEEMQTYGRHLDQWERKIYNHLLSIQSLDLPTYEASLHDPDIRFTPSLCDAIPLRYLKRLAPA